MIPKLAMISLLTVAVLTLVGLPALAMSPKVSAQGAVTKYYYYTPLQSHDETTALIGFHGAQAQAIARNELDTDFRNKIKNVHGYTPWAVGFEFNYQAPLTRRKAYADAAQVAANAGSDMNLPVDSAYVDALKGTGYLGLAYLIFVSK